MYPSMKNWQNSFIATLNNNIYWTIFSIQLHVFYYEQILIYYSYKRRGGEEKDTVNFNIIKWKGTRKREEKKKKWSMTIVYHHADCPGMSITLLLSNVNFSKHLRETCKILTNIWASQVVNVTRCLVLNLLSFLIVNFLDIFLGRKNVRFLLI